MALMQQVSLHSFKNSILSSVLSQTVEKSHVDTSKSFAYCDEEVLDINRLFPSKNKGKILLLSGYTTVLLVDNIDTDDTALSMGTRFCLSFDHSFRFTDFSFATGHHSEDTIVSSFISPLLKRCYVLWGPDYQGYNHQKLRVEFVGACKWHKDYLVYGINSNFVLVNDIERHFTMLDGCNAGATKVKTNATKWNYVTALECTESIIYVGLRSGYIFGYDKRAFSKSCLGFHPGL